jgi:hypothetical protein
MEQRRLRLGDIVDDYCPRERRLTNHAIVAMVEDDVKQTRCTTCDAEHVYKGGQAPRKRRKDSTSALYREVLAGMPEAAEVAPAPIPEVVLVAPVPVVAVGVDEPVDPIEESVAIPVPVPFDEPAEAREDDARVGDDGPIHRRLIRATLPRVEGQKEVRQTPDFTIRSNGNRPGGGFRGDRMRGQGGANNSMRAGGRRFGGPQSGQGNGRPGGGRSRSGFGGGNQRGPGGNHGHPQGGRKRSR